MTTRQVLILVITSLFVFHSEARSEEETSTLRDLDSHVRMRSEPVQQIPGSITVITGETLEATWRRDLENLETYVPGLVIDDLANTPQGAAISLRGVGSGDLSKGRSPAVAVTIDGVYVGTHSGRMLSLFDMEQVEVARGISGPLQGAPSPGGSINLRRTRPTGNPGVEARASADQYNGRQFSARFNFPLIAAIAGKITFDWERGGGEFVKNLVADRGGENQAHRTAVSASLLWAANDSTEVQYTFDSDVDNGDSPMLLNLSTDNDLLCRNATARETCGSILAPALPQTGSINFTAQNFSNAREFEGDYHTLRVNLGFANHDVTSITGFRRTREKLDQDLDATFVDFYSTSRKQDYEQFSQEFRILSTTREDFSYVLGAYFLESDYDRLQEDPFILNALDDAGLTTPRADGETRRIRTSQDMSLQSWFGYLEFKLDDQWTADIGLRGDRLEKDFDHRPLELRIGGIVPSPIRITESQTWNETRANAALRYTVDENALIWFRYTWDYRPGGFNENAVSEDSAGPWRIEEIRGYEVGLKSEWFDDRLRLNAVVYNTDHNNRAEPFVETVASGQVESVVDNVASLEIRGSEIELEWSPGAGFDLQVAASHINADYDKYKIPDLSGTQAFVDLNGLFPNRAPRDSVAVTARHTFRFAEGKIRTFFGYRYSTDYQTNPRLRIAKVGNFATLDLSIDYVWNEWTFRLFGQNVKNKRFLLNVMNPTAADIVSMDPNTTVPTPLVTWAEYNRPRYTGFQIIYRPEFQNVQQTGGM